MTVLLPGMTEEDQRVKISSADDPQQGLLECWKAKVNLIELFSLTKLVLNSFRSIQHIIEHGQHR